MNIWQRSPNREADAQLDARIEASRTRFLAEHDATFDHESGWADIVARANLAVVDDGRLDGPNGGVPDEVPTDDLPPLGVDPVDRGLPRSGRQMALAGAGCIAAAAVLLVGVVVLGDGPDVTDDSDPDLAARIVAATESALEDAVEHQVTDWFDTAIPVDHEAWRDQTTDKVRMLDHAPDGRGPSFDWGPAAPPTVDDEPDDVPEGPLVELSVDHCYREYTFSEHEIPDDVVGYTASIAQATIDGLREGYLQTDGTEVVDGQELIRVVQDEDPTGATWYVDPETYRPVRVAAPAGEETGDGYVTTVEYLPRTPELLAGFTPAIPGGYTEVDELTRSDDHMPGCQ